MSDSAPYSVYPPVYPHDPIEEIAQDVFMVRGSLKMNALLRISRNMAVIRHNSELTLVNPVRLHAAEEEKLQTLGTIGRPHLTPCASGRTVYSRSAYGKPSNSKLGCS